jgi:hypothetical protein
MPGIHSEMLHRTLFQESYLLGQVCLAFLLSLEETTNDVLTLGIFVGLCAGFVTDLILDLEEHDMYNSKQTIYQRELA